MEKEHQYKKMLITVNGKPVGRELWIDKITYAKATMHEQPEKPCSQGPETA
ncbi:MULTISPECIES: hypothetical protein [Paenibacillus]|uniref:Uncharacterized protein n=1 Tax=Paenibacillus albilobatus TaxID=2716884 RepID=A0A920CEF2_9BACL|nr:MULTISPECIES: hypothetical protein [Paenibacillus]MDR9856764.1 hypothetical protein [Paenibacillus sp. VCA1]GIO33864.1 hypothetical protein J2TS6_50050 [Paenibacillus albilobatus]